MGAMLVRAMLRSGAAAATDIWVANRSLTKLESLAAEYPGLHCVHSATVAAETQILFLCVKPADTAIVLQEIEGRLQPRQICVFLTNVFSFCQLDARIPCRTVKLIPSITQQINRGVALVAYGPRIEATDATALHSLLRPVCQVLVVGETQIRALADLTSCGPALLAACVNELYLQTADRATDIPVASVTQAALETLAATVELLRSGISPRELMQQVAVPGGMTAAGLQALLKHIPQVMAAVFDATQQTEERKRTTVSLDRDA